MQSPRLTPERAACVQLMALAVRGLLGDSVTDEARALLRARADWSELVPCALGHGLVCQLDGMLRRNSLQEYLSEDVALQLKRAALGQTGAAMLALDAFAGIGRAISEVAPSTVWLKGPALAQIAWGNPLARVFVDFDLLVREGEWQGLRGVMLDHGFVPRGRDLETLPPRLTKEDMLDHWLAFKRDDGLSVDCTLDPLELGLRMRGLEEAFASAVAIDLDGASVRVLSPEHQLLTLCVHLNRHGFTQLKWFADIAALISNVNMDQELVAELCEAEGVSASVYYTMRQVERVFGRSLDESVMKRLRPGPLRQAVWSATWPSRHIRSFAGRQDVGIVFPKNRSRAWLIPNLVLTGRVRDKARYYVRHVFPPPEYIAHVVPSTAGSASYPRQLLLRYVAAAGERFGRGSRGEARSGAVDEVRERLRPTGEIPLQAILRDSGVPDGTHSPVVSVIIPTYAHPKSELLIECLEGLADQTEDGFEVVVVCNGPVPVVEEARTREWPFALRVVELSRNFRPAAAINVGARFARAPLLCFLDDDGVPFQDWVAEHRRAHREGARAARGALVPRDSSHWLNEVEFGASTLPGSATPHLLDREGNMSIQRQLFVTVNGFDPLLRGFHGAELTHRLVASGVPASEIVAWPWARIAHDHASTLPDLMEKHFRWSRNRARLAVTQPPLASFVAAYSVDASDQPVEGNPKKRRMARALASAAGKVGWYAGEIPAVLTSRRSGDVV